MESNHKLRLFWCAIVLVLPQISEAGPRQSATSFYRTESAAHHKDDVHYKYKYQYAVNDPVSGVVSGAAEQRSGDFVRGMYSFLQPDGQVRTVDYEVDGDRGFHAVIRTNYPGTSLLSIQSAAHVMDVYRDSPVNIRAKAGLGVPEFARQNPRFSARDNLPFNYHARDGSKFDLLDNDDQDVDLDLQNLEQMKPPELENHLTLNNLKDLQNFRRQPPQDFHQLGFSKTFPVWQLPSTDPPIQDISYLNPSAGTQLHTLAIIGPPVRSVPQVPQVVSSPHLSFRRQILRSNQRQGPPRIIQHLTETSPGISNSRSYFLP